MLLNFPKSSHLCAPNRKSQCLNVQSIALNTMETQEGQSHFQPFMIENGGVSPAGITSYHLYKDTYIHIMGHLESNLVIALVFKILFYLWYVFLHTHTPSHLQLGLSPL